MKLCVAQIMASSRRALLARQGIAALLIGVAGVPSHAADADDGSVATWRLHVGPARIKFADRVSLQAAGATVSGAAIHTAPDYTLAVEADRRLIDQLYLGVTLGLPPHTQVEGRDVLSPYGALGAARYGAASLTAIYRPTFGRIAPYVGGGLAYMHIFKTADGTLTQLRVSDDAGPVVQAGMDLMVARHLGLFADVKRAWLRNGFHGDLGPVPASGQIRSDPLVMHGGMAMLF